MSPGGKASPILSQKRGPPQPYPVSMARFFEDGCVPRPLSAAAPAPGRRWAGPKVLTESYSLPLLP